MRLKLYVFEVCFKETYGLNMPKILSRIFVSWETQEISCRYEIGGATHWIVWEAEEGEDNQ